MDEGFIRDRSPDPNARPAQVSVHKSSEPVSLVSPHPQTISVSKTLDNLNKNKFLPIIRPQFLVHPPQRRQRLQVREFTRSFKFGANFSNLNLKKKKKKLADFFLQKNWLVENESVPKGEAKEPADEKSAEKLDNGRNCRWKKRRLISFSFTELKKKKKEKNG